MSKPQLEIDDKSYYKETHFLYEVLGTLKDVDEVKIFFKDILTHSELRMFKKRWYIASMLRQGLDIRKVANKSKSGVQTVCKIKNILENGHGGLSIALERMENKEKKQKKDYLKLKSKYGGSKFVKGWFK